jgi:hypothetical protein
MLGAIILKQAMMYALKFKIYKLQLNKAAVLHRPCHVYFFVRIYALARKAVPQHT